VFRRRRPLGVGALAGISTFIAVFAIAGGGATASAACSTANTLTGSNFEVDVNANLKVDGPADCIDWLAGGTGTKLRPGVLAKDDKPSGGGDDSFGQGTKEDTANPTIVSGAIPPNKSDLKKFGVFTETAGTGKFLELFWSRVQNPSGTTNMDFELNQKFCDPTATPTTNCANNGSGVTPETPLRTTGDKLITYDLSKGGTVPTISIRTWSGSAWGSPTVISGAGGNAIGSVNTTTIPATETGEMGSQDPFTFGEAAINFNALFPPGSGCGTFGSAYLKSRSSDSFQAELKDFIAPEQVAISNCTTLTTTASGPVTIGNSIHDTASLAGATASATGTITFKVYGSLSDCNSNTNVLDTTTATVNGNGNYNSGNFTPTATGTYFWTASYSGDLNNAASSSACGASGESSVVNKKQPALSTTASGPVTIGDSIHDTATLSAATADATGTITFKVYASAADCIGNTNVLDTSTATVNGNGSYNSGNFTPSATGTYIWTAEYSGDSKNLGAGPTSCNDLAEQSVVNKAPAVIATAQTLTPQDSATLSASAGGNPTGDVTFKLFGPGDATCSGNPVYEETVTLHSDPNDPDVSVASTANSTFSVSAANADTYRWLVTYGGDASHDGTTSACGTEQFTLTIANS
jgi:hypothetical protein